MDDDFNLPEESLEKHEEASLGAIDTHVHFWKYNRKRDAWITDKMKLLQQDYLPEHLALNLKRNGVAGCVAVQVDQSETDTRFLVELSHTHPVIKGVVGWLDLTKEDLPDRLQEFSVHSVIKGYRHLVQSEPDDFLLRPDFQRGIRTLKEYGYTYDILIYPRQLEAAVKFVGKFPDQRLVVDHCAKPDIKSGQFDHWKEHMKELAKRHNVYCKLSGLFTEAAWKKWNPADFYPVFDVVFKEFGVNRLLYGSDWPVMLLSGMYVQWKSLLEKYMEGFAPDDIEKVFRGNAEKFYRLSEG